MKIVEVKHPLVKHKLGLMREQDISTKRFRELASEVGSLLTYEATADLETEKVTIEGWNGPVEIDQIKGKKITFRFKGKTYKAKTNKKGIAKVKIKKKVIKKLKKGKTYKVKITYAIKDKYGNGYVTIKNAVKCKVKVKK